MSSLPGLLMAAAALISAAIVIASPLTEWVVNTFANSIANLFFPDKKSPRLPIYGPAEARRMEGRYEEAIQAYEAILAEFPADGRCYLALMDIAWRDLQDARRAMGFYQRATQAVKNASWRGEMRHAYEDFAPALTSGSNQVSLPPPQPQSQVILPRPKLPPPTRHYLGGTGPLS